MSEMIIQKKSDVSSNEWLIAVPFDRNWVDEVNWRTASTSTFKTSFYDLTP